MSTLRRPFYGLFRGVTGHEPLRRITRCARASNVQESAWSTALTAFDPLASLMVPKPTLCPPKRP